MLWQRTTASTQPCVPSMYSVMEYDVATKKISPENHGLSRTQAGASTSHMPSQLICMLVSTFDYAANVGLSCFQKDLGHIATMCFYCRCLTYLLLKRFGPQCIHVVLQSLFLCSATLRTSHSHQHHMLVKLCFLVCH